jgi:Flp pilus assembly protein TadG
MRNARCQPCHILSGRNCSAAPLLFLLLFGITEFGRALWLYGTMSHGAREAARYAIVRGAESGRAVTSNDIEAYVRNVVGLSTAQVTTTWAPDNKPGSVVQVRVQAPFESAVPIIPSMPLSTTSRLVISF